MITYKLTIGDGHCPNKDVNMLVQTSFEYDDLDEWLLKLVAACFPSLADELDCAPIDATEDDKGVYLCLNEGPFGETDGYAGPWLVAELRKVEPKTVAEPARDELQLELSEIWGTAA